MPRTSDKRERLVEAADKLIHVQGFHKTTLADIASESGVPLGNVYYYFKTKEEICDAVIAERKKDLSSTLNTCCRSNDPRKALLRLVKTMADASEDIAETGCPHGRLCSEMSNEIDGLSNSAEDCLKVLLEWSTEQFQGMGLGNAKELGFEFISRIQGTVLLGNTLHDAKQLKSQFRQISKWIESLQVTEAKDEAAA